MCLRAKVISIFSAHSCQESKSVYFYKWSVTRTRCLTTLGFFVFGEGFHLLLLPHPHHYLRTGFYDATHFCLKLWTFFWTLDLIVAELWLFFDICTPFQDFKLSFVCKSLYVCLCMHIFTWTSDLFNYPFLVSPTPHWLLVDLDLSECCLWT